jgi:hypothetical protein
MGESCALRGADFVRGADFAFEARLLVTCARGVLIFLRACLRVRRLAFPPLDFVVRCLRAAMTEARFHRFRKRET